MILWKPSSINCRYWLKSTFFIVFVWFLQVTQYYTLWLDYSQNIAFTEKKQVQVAHFSGKQHTLHNTVIQSPNDEKVYLYHLSYDVNHNSVLTFYIIKDIIHNHPEVIQKGYLILCSDNCQEQYKCKFTFQMKKIAAEFGITAVWFYGEPGHGRGLVDAMSSFGCKQQLRHEIVTNDAWFANAEQMVQFLTKYFSNDSSKEYYCVDAAETAQIRTKEKGEFILKPCRQFHDIGVNQKGNFAKVLYFRDQDIVSTLFDKTVCNIDEEHNNDDNQTEPAFSLNHDTIFELVDPNTFVGIRSPPNANKPFFIVEVFNKGVAQEGMLDANGHYILSGEQYAEVGRLQKKMRRRELYDISTRKSNRVFTLMLLKCL